MTKTKVLMLVPHSEPTFWDGDIAVRLAGRKKAMPPLGLLTVAGMLPSHLFDIRLIDLDVKPLTDEMIRWADVVMITGSIVQASSMQQLIAWIKRIDKRKVVVTGGPHSSRNPEMVLEWGADVVVKGDAELTFALFVQDWLAAGKPLRKIYDGKDAAVRECCHVAVDDDGNPDMSESPTPRWDLIDPRDYMAFSAQFSRGCPFGCEICDVGVYEGRVPRTKTIDQFIRELDAMYEAGWRGSVFIVDNNFIGYSQEKVLALLDAIIVWQERHGWPFGFFIQASINLARRPTILRKMKMAGFISVFIGIESTDTAVRTEIGKVENHGMDLAESVRILQAAGLEVQVGLIIGNDKDPDNACGLMLDFAQENGIVFAMVSLLIALDRTKLFDRLKAAGRLREGEVRGSNTTRLGFNFELLPPRNEQGVVADFVWLYQKLYSPRNYFRRCLTLGSRRGPYLRPKRFDWRGILAAFGVFRHFLLRFDWGSVWFMLFIIQTLFTRPRDLAEAIVQSAKLIDLLAQVARLTRAHAEQVAAYPEGELVAVH